MTEFTDLLDLAAARLGGRVLAANDEFFAPKENLLEEGEPVWREGVYTERGKWMDGWETRRRRDAGDDWCLVRLGLPGLLRGVDVDTRHFKGNFPESFSLEGIGASSEATADALQAAGAEWLEVVPRSPLRGDSRNLVAVSCPWRLTHLRLRIYPDGGVARLRVHGEPLPPPAALAGELDLAAAAAGGRVEDWSDRFFGAPHALLLPDPPRGMHDGWETRRRRGPGHDWVVVRLAAPGHVRRIVVDTAHFKGNAPASCWVEGAPHPPGDPPGQALEWTEILPRTPLAADTRHEFEARATDLPVARVRLSVFPDGGVARLRLWGAASAAGRRAAALRWLHALPPAQAAAELVACVGSRRWAAALAGRRPFADLAALRDACDMAAIELAEDDWWEAFASHPEIGRPAGGAHGEGSRRWSGAEQAATADADQESRARLAAGNRRYRERFGHPFIVRAAGRGPVEILALLEHRLENDPATELHAAAAEQREIARLRLGRLLGEIE